MANYLLLQNGADRLLLQAGGGDLLLQAGGSPPPPAVTGAFHYYAARCRELSVFKNVASQKVTLFAFDYSTGAPKTGDAANLTFYVSKDDGAVTALGDTSATEDDATNAKGMYTCDLTQAETNADKLKFTGKSSTANVTVVPVVVYTVPANFTAQSIDSSGRVDVAKIAGTSQTARDIGASVLLSSGTGAGQLNVTSGVVQADAAKINGVATSSVTAVNANLGTTQPVNFTGTAGAATVKADLIDVAGAAVSTSAAQLGVNVVNFGGSAGSFTSGKPAVTLAAADVSGNVAADLQTVKTQTVTCAGGVTVPAATLASTTNITAGTVTTVSGNVAGSVGSVTGNVGGNVTGSVGSVASGGIARASFAADTGLQTIRSGTAQGGSSGSLTLDAGASSVDDFYTGCLLYVVGGAGAGQARVITSYVGASRSAGVTQPFAAAPDNTSAFAVLAAQLPSVTAGAIDVVTSALAVSSLANDCVTANSIHAGAITAAKFAAGAITSTVAPNLDAAVSSRQATFTAATGVTFPANFGVLSIDANGRAKIQSGVPKNTALAGFGFVMVDSADHVTGKTGLTVTATRSLDGAAFASCANSVSEVGNGVYKIDLAAADLNANTVVLRFAATGADARLIEVLTTP